MEGEEIALAFHASFAPRGVPHFKTAATVVTALKDGSRWYIHAGGKALGPYERPDIELMIRNGQIPGTEYLCVEGGSEWIEARSDPTFGKLFSDRVEVAAILPDAPSGTSSDTANVYAAKPGT